LVAFVTPLRLFPTPSFEEGSAIAALFVTDPDEAVHADADALRAVWGLTRAEAKIAAALASGHSLRDVADERGITLNTARWHLKHILAKTETRTQAGLARLLAIPPGGCAVRSDRR
jgi:DNA-binding CsgD family transcriptional regulator